MKKTVICRKKNKGFKYSVFFAFLYVMALSLSSCGGKEETAELAELQFPSFQDIIDIDNLLVEQGDEEENVLPVKIYFDNTGSMKGFIIGTTSDGRGKIEPSQAYQDLMLSLRDIGGKQDTEYYVLDKDKQDWVLYEDGIYNNFKQDEFYVGWNSGQPGPLAKLYMNDKIDEKCVNIVLTDLAEQNLNNTLLAEKIRKICDEKGCEADLYAFKFEFNGPTQAPDPSTMGKMGEKNVNGEKPYYMIVTGPAKYMVKYREELQEILKNSGLDKETDYYMVTNHMDINNDTVTVQDVVFEPFADYHDLKQQKEDEKKIRNKRGDESEGEDAEGISLNGKSQNLQRYEDISRIFEGDVWTEPAVFEYEKVDGVSDYDDWKLNFYVPLNDFAIHQLDYKYDCHIYTLVQKETEEEPEQQDGTGLMGWIENKESRIDISMEEQMDFEGEDRKYPAVLYISCKDRKVETDEKKEHGPREKELLLILEITRDDMYSYEEPDWLAEFDTGDTEDYYAHTYNLTGFYDILYKNELGDDGKVHVRRTYAKIPILLMDLEE